MIDVIVPVYNVAKYLKKCVNSVINQKYTQWQLILVDDGSTDESGELCDYFADKDSRIVSIHKPNGGLSSARNAGLKQSKGDYVLFLDSDDYLGKDALSVLIASAEYSSADIIFGGYAEVNENYDIIGLFSLNERLLVDDERLLIVYEYPQLVMSCGKLFKRAVLDGFEFLKGKLHEDVFAYHHLALKANAIFVIPNTVFNYLKRSSSITSRSFSLRNFDALDGLIDRVEYLKKNNYNNLARITIDYFYKYLVFIVHRIDFSNSEQNAKFYDYYNLWKEYSGSSRDREFKCICLLYRWHLLYKPFLKYRIREIRMVWSARKIVFKVILSSLLHHKNYYLISTPLHGNLGDQAIVFAQVELLKQERKNIVEISSVEYLAFKPILRRIIRKRDVIIIDGGGNIGTTWPTENDRIKDIITRFNSNKIIIFPETAFFSDSKLGKVEYDITKKVYNSHNNLYVFLRDDNSYRLMSMMLSNKRLFLCPDIVVSLLGNIHVAESNREGILLCLRKDKERKVGDSETINLEKKLNQMDIAFYHTDTVINQLIDCKNRKQMLYKKWEEFSRAKLVITDRLHGMLFAFITKTPCIAINNINKKVQYQYGWIKEYDWIKVVDHIKDVIPLIKQMSSSPVKKTASEFTFDCLRKVVNSEN